MLLLCESLSPVLGIITTIAGDGQAVNAGDGGLATSASVCVPNGIAVVESSGDTYFTSQCHLVRMITKSSGIITTVAGTGATGYTGDGGPAKAAAFNQPASIAIDPVTGNIYIADSGNHAIRLITKRTGIISTVAGTGIAGRSFVGSHATKTLLLNPLGVGIDGLLRHVYIADSGNNRVLRISMKSVRISHIAGLNNSAYSGTYSGDKGKAKMAGLANPSSIAVDKASSNIYITDTFNNRVRMISKSTDIITTVAGTGVPGFSGDGGLATNASLINPGGITIDQSTGNFYITQASRVRMINVKSGRISTIAGTAVSGYSGDGGFATAAQLFDPKAVAVDSSSGALLIADTSNSRIRSITGTPTSSYSPTSSTVPSPSPSASQAPSSNSLLPRTNSPSSGTYVLCLDNYAIAMKSVYDPSTSQLVSDRNYQSISWNRRIRL